jgi:hypothetical protein
VDHIRLKRNALGMQQCRQQWKISSSTASSAGSAVNLQFAQVEQQQSQQHQPLQQH